MKNKNNNFKKPKKSRKDVFKRISIKIFNDESEIVTKLDELVEKCKTIHPKLGEKVTYREIFLFAVQLIDEGHLEKIKRSTMGKWDLISLDYEKNKKVEDQDLEMVDYIFEKLKLKFN